MFLKILSLLLIVPGVLIIYASKYIVKKYNLAQKQTYEVTEDMDQEELEKFKVSKAILNVKMIGMLISLPGLILFIMVFR